MYEYALKYVPLAMKDCFDKSGEQIDALKMVFLHQANEKMDQAIIDRFFELYGIQEVPQYMMPMNISFMGNSSVATIPTLLHQGMVCAGVPYTETALNTTLSGGTPYGPSHVESASPDGGLTEDEVTLARALGRRVATLALRLRRRN